MTSMYSPCGYGVQVQAEAAYTVKVRLEVGSVGIWPP